METCPNRGGVLRGLSRTEHRSIWRQTADGTTSSRDLMEETGNQGGENLIQTSTARNRRTVLSGRMPRAGVDNGPTGEGGAFSNPTEKFGEKSMFNKEKYLPLARDIPVAISHLCCSVMKKAPMAAYQRKNHVVPFLGTLAEESRLRKQAWIRHGCNAFDTKKPTSQPLAIWREQDILHYIVNEGLEICSVYGDIVATDGENEYPADSLIGGTDGMKLCCTGCDRTGCMFCAFGMHMEKGMTRFQRMAYTHPRQYEYALGGGQWVDNPAYDPTAPKMDGEWQNWNPKQIWVPSKKGLGMKKVFDMVNEIYGKDFYKYD